ncbi:DUF4433 domain-containing protein [bacterium]|nr:DUF4433 domain-containing protein [bacterium]
MFVPANPKIYHIVHVDRLASIIDCGCLLCDAEVNRRVLPGTTLGMSRIKHRRLNELFLNSYPHLHVGDCVPFYLCPRSVMLYLINKQNPDLSYKGGQDPIIHLEADLSDAVAWANSNNHCWAFTTSNAGAIYFDDYCELKKLDKIDWAAVNARSWSDCKDGKQAEFLFESSFSFGLVKRIGVCTERINKIVNNALLRSPHKPVVEIKRDWYY